MTNRYRAGQPADLSHMLHRYTQCPAADSACNGPKEGECAGLCDYPSGMPVQFAGDEPDEIEMRRDRLIYGTSFSVDGKRIDPTSIYIMLEPTETPLRARIIDAAADALDWVLDRLWVGSVVLVVAVGLLVWSLR